MVVVPAKVSGKDFFSLLGCDISDIVSYYGDNGKIYLTVYLKDDEGNQLFVGPKFAQNPATRQVVVELVKPGRPMGTTVANGAAPKTSKKVLS